MYGEELNEYNCLEASYSLREIVKFWRESILELKRKELVTVRGLIEKKGIKNSGSFINKP